MGNYIYIFFYLKKIVINVLIDILLIGIIIGMFYIFFELLNVGITGFAILVNNVLIYVSP